MSKHPAILLLGDAMSVLPRIHTRVHAVITDPPYNIGKWGLDWKQEHASNNQAVKLKAAGQNFRPEQYAELHTFTYDWASRVEALPGAFFCVFSQPRLSGAVMGGLVQAGLHIRDQLIWAYPRGQMKAQDLSRYAPDTDFQGRKTAQFAPEYEAIIMAQKPLDGKLPENWKKHQTGLACVTYSDGMGRGQVLSYLKPNKAERNGHPTQKPLSLMTDLIERFTLPNQIVLDPFAGSATTLAAARACGRRSLGIERDKAYFAAGLERLA